MAQGPKRTKSDPTIVIVLLICVLVGMWQGARGLVTGASAGDRERGGAVAIENAETFNGSLRISTAACHDTKGLDEVRYRVEDSRGREVAKEVHSFVAGRVRQAASIGSGLAADRYRAEVTCLSNGQPVGEAHVTHATVGKGGGSRRPAQLPDTGH
ncbi:hypothetical protein [Luteococcus sp. OSA5]|uniref:hypothetical protein n=1 Tax=Luteococcus sp. OSA5 TaxID=3401630 RepID=UPI003B42B95C